MPVSTAAHMLAMILFQELTLALLSSTTHSLLVLDCRSCLLCELCWGPWVPATMS